MIDIALFALFLLFTGTDIAPAPVSAGEAVTTSESGWLLAPPPRRAWRRLGVSHPSVPDLTTAEAYGITGYSAFSGGEVTSDGGAEVTSRGVCWSTGLEPTIADSRTTDGTGSGSFMSYLPGLVGGTTYSVRAYATNAVGTGYGSAVTFSTLTPDPRLEYMGQTPPGRQFVRFARGIVPEDMFHSVTVSPDDQEIYWGELNGHMGGTRLMVTRIRNGRWTTPEPVSLGGQPSGEFWDDAPVVSPDNRTLFFTSFRPFGTSALARWWFMYAERTATGWSPAVPLPEVISAAYGGHWGFSVARSGTVYFGALSGDSELIYSSRLIEGQYEAPVPLGVVNALASSQDESYINCPFVAPDESYLIVNRVERGRPVGYYISFKGGDGEWLAPELLAEFSSPAAESTFVTRDGRYVFCHSYWASAEIIEDLRPSGSQSSAASPTNPRPW